MTENKKHEHEYYPVEIYVLPNFPFAIVKLECIDANCPNKDESVEIEIAEQIYP